MISNWCVSTSLRVDICCNSDLRFPSSDQGILCAKDSEPVFFHEKPPSVPEQLISDYFIRGIVDFTPGSGVWAHQAIRKNLPYVGVTCSDDHYNGVQRWLLKCLQRGIEDASDQTLYRADLVAEPDEPNPKKARKDQPLHQVAIAEANGARTMQSCSVNCRACMVGAMMATMKVMASLLSELTTLGCFGVRLISVCHPQVFPLQTTRPKIDSALFTCPSP